MVKTGCPPTPLEDSKCSPHHLPHGALSTSRLGSLKEFPSRHLQHFIWEFHHHSCQNHGKLNLRRHAHPKVPSFLSSTSLFETPTQVASPPLDHTFKLGAGAGQLSHQSKPPPACYIVSQNMVSNNGLDLTVTGIHYKMGTKSDLSEFTEYFQEQLTLRYRGQANPRHSEVTP